MSMTVSLSNLERLSAALALNAYLNQPISEHLDGQEIPVGDWREALWVRVPGDLYR